MASIALYLLTALKIPKFLIPISSLFIGDSRSTIPLVIVLRPSFFLRVVKVTIVIGLVFRVGGCAIVILHLMFRDCELPFLWHVIVLNLPSQLRLACSLPYNSD